MLVASIPIARPVYADLHATARDCTLFLLDGVGSRPDHGCVGRSKLVDAIDTHVIEDDDQQTERWPRLMTARTAAAYCDERSPYSFRRAVGTLWPHPINIPGKGARWLKEDLDSAIDRLTPGGPRDAADVL